MVSNPSSPLKAQVREPKWAPQTTEPYVACCRRRSRRSTVPAHRLRQEALLTDEQWPGSQDNRGDWNDRSMTSERGPCDLFRKAKSTRTAAERGPASCCRASSVAVGGSGVARYALRRSLAWTLIQGTTIPGR